VPLQNTVVVTLHTAAAGPTGKGRFYIPTPVVGTLGQDGRMSTGARDAITTAAVGFIQAVNTAANLMDANSKVVVASGGSITKGIPAALRTVTGVSVGRVVDTQRRRRADQLEERVRVAV